MPYFPTRIVAVCLCFRFWRFLRHQSVLAAARDTGLDDRLSVVDVSMLAELTGGRRSELLNVLERVKQTSGGLSVWGLTTAPPPPTKLLESTLQLMEGHQRRVVFSRARHDTPFSCCFVFIFTRNIIFI